MRTDDAPVANLFGASHGIAQNKRMSILRETSGHTPARKKRGNTVHCASSLKARITIEETLAADTSSHHVGDPCNFCNGSSDFVRAAVVTPDGDDDSDERVDESDDDDYNPESGPSPKQQKKKAKKKPRETKVVLDRKFMCVLQQDTFNHEPFRKGKPEVYSTNDIDRFDSDFKKQLHFNFAATRNTQKQRQSLEATCASRLRDIDLDLIQRESTQLTTNRSYLSRYILEDVLNCPPGSRFIVCIVTEANDIKRGEYYSNKASQISNEILLVKGDCEYWKMRGRRYFVRQACLDRSSHYSEIKMRSVLLNQFIDSFENEGGDFAFWFEGTATKLTIPWRDVIHTSKTVMIFGAPFSQGRLFAELFRKKKPKYKESI